VLEMTEEQSRVAEVARGILEKLLDLLAIPASIVISADFPVDGKEAASASVALTVEGDDLGILIGRRGQTLSALQYLIRLIVTYQTETGLPIIIDVEGYKRRRCEALRDLAFRIAEQVITRNSSFALEPMSAFERRIIHLTLVDHPDVTTESTGVGEMRKVVILPRGQ